MDPFSISAGSVALLGSLFAIVTKTASVLQSIKDAPIEIQALSEETKHLKTVIEDILDAVQVCEEESTADVELSMNPAALPDIPATSLAPLTPDTVIASDLNNTTASHKPDVLIQHVHSAQVVFRELQRLLEDLIVQSPSGQVKFNRIAWLTRKRKRAGELRKDLNSLKIDLATLMLNKNFRRLSTMGEQVQTLTVTSDRKQNALFQLLVHVIKGQSDLSVQIENLRVKDQGPSAAHGDYEVEEVSDTGEDQAPATMSSRIDQASGDDADGAHEDQLRDSTDVLVDDSVPPSTSTGIEAYKQLGRPSKSKVVRTICKPLFLSHVFGRFVIGVRSRSYLSADDETCLTGRREKRCIVISYYFPSWLIARQIILKYTTRPLGTPQAGLYTRRLLPGDSTLIRSVGKDDVSTVKQLFEQGLATPDDIEPMSFSALTCAISMGKTRVLKFLLHCGGDVLLEDSFGNSALDFAWIAKLENRLSPDVLSFLNNSTSFFLKSEDDPGYDTLEKYEFTAIHRSILDLPEGDTSKSLLTKASRALLDETDILGKTPLLWAARRGDFSTAKILLSRRADPNIADSMLRTPLHMACRAQHIALIKELIHHGADVSARNFLNETPAHYACYENGRTAMLEILIAAGIDVNAPSKFGKTMLDIVVQSNASDAVKLLLGKQVSADGLRNTAAISDWLERPIGKAVLFDAPDALEILLEYADLDFVDSKGRSLLHIVGQYASAVCLAKVIRCERKPSEQLIGLQNEDGQTAREAICTRALADAEEFSTNFEQLLQLIVDANEVEEFCDAVSSQD